MISKLLIVSAIDTMHQRFVELLFVTGPPSNTEILMSDAKISLIADRAELVRD